MVIIALLSSKINDAVQNIASLMVKARDNYQEGPWTVYVLEDNNGVKYVGRTKNKVARETWHSKTRPRLRFRVLYEDLTYAEARGLEQMYMDHYKTITGNFPNNRIRGISLMNPNINGYINAGYRYLYDRIENELLSLFGG